MRFFASSSFHTTTTNGVRRGAALLFAVLVGCAPVPSSAPPGPVNSAVTLVGPAHPGAETPLSVADSAWVEMELASMTPRERAAQLIMPWVPGEYAAVGSPEYEQVRRWVEDDKVGGLVLSIGMPLSYGAKLNHMQRLAKVPLLIASDMENGSGMRLGGSYAFPSLLPQGGGTVFPPVMAVGATGSEDLARKLGEVTGEEARAVGVHINFGPVLDVNSNPLNPIINTRSFGENPAAVSRLTAAYIRGAREKGLLTTGKHFPGHGDAATDSHTGLPTIQNNRQHLDSVDFPPFREAVSDGVDAIMTAHIAITGILGPDAPPATLSPYFMTGVLRKEMHFDGLLITDAMTMGGVALRYGATEPLILAVEAGADILLMPHDVTEAINTITSAVSSGRLTQERIDSSVRRILVAKARAGLRTGRLIDLNAVDEVVNSPGNAAIAAEVAEKSITLARDDKSLVPIGSAKRILSLTYADQTDALAGRIFNQTLRSAGLTVITEGVTSRTTPDEFAKLQAEADSVDLVIASAYVFPREGAGTISAQGGFSGFLTSLASANRNVVAISFGSPYLVGAFPSVPAYMLAWGGAPVSQRAAAEALLGRASITGRLPVSIPPLFKLGDGIDRTKQTKKETR